MTEKKRHRIKADQRSQIKLFIAAAAAAAAAANRVIWTTTAGDSRCIIVLKDRTLVGKNGRKAKNLAFLTDVDVDWE